jgi:hypothetical protein
VTIIPRIIPVPDRGEEVDTTTFGQRDPRKDGLTVSVKWHLSAWNHESASEVFEAIVPNEVTLRQMITEFVGPFFQGRIDGRSRHRWHGEKPPDQLPEGYEFQIETMMIQTNKQTTNICAGGPRMIPSAPSDIPGWGIT